MVVIDLDCMRSRRRMTIWSKRHGLFGEGQWRLMDDCDALTRPWMPKWSILDGRLIYVKVELGRLCCTRGPCHS
jgi:hypothetical protein